MSEEGMLIDRAAEGEAAALESLAVTYRAVSYRIALAILGDSDSAEDVAQDVLVRLAAAVPGFQGGTELKGWVYRVTVNLCRDRLRRRRRRSGDVPIEDAAGRRDLAAEEQPERAVDLERARAAVAEAMAQLPDEQRQVLTLRFVTGLSYAEIASRTSTAQGTIASRVFRALRRLGESLDARHLEVLK